MIDPTKPAIKPGDIVYHKPTRESWTIAAIIPGSRTPMVRMSTTTLKKFSASDCVLLTRLTRSEQREFLLNLIKERVGLLSSLAENYLEHFHIGGWYCPESPNGECRYTVTEDECDFCGEPLERK
jgi:energy-converting hydrogenase Eha subunit A